MNTENSIIKIEQDDVLENLDSLMENSKLFTATEEIKNLNVFIFYIENGKVDNYKKYEVKINRNTLKKKEMMALILNNNKYYSKKYDLIGIYQYNFNLKSEDLKPFFKNRNQYNFVKSYKKLQEIKYGPCMELFQENNHLFLLFNTASPVILSQPKENKEESLATKTPVENKSSSVEQEIDKINIKKSDSTKKTLKRVRFSDTHNNNNKSLKKTI